MSFSFVRPIPVPDHDAEFGPDGRYKLIAGSICLQWPEEGGERQHVVAVIYGTDIEFGDATIPKTLVLLRLVIDGIIPPQDGFTEERFFEWVMSEILREQPGNVSGNLVTVTGMLGGVTNCPEAWWKQVATYPL